MAQRTIAPGGGDWNNTATWVEGAVPTTSDHIVGDASSGQLTVNVTATVQYLDLSLYTNTLTISNFRTLTFNLAGSTTTFGASMNFAGAGTITTANALNIAQNTTNRIPNFSLSGSAIRTLLTDLYIVNFVFGISNFGFNGFSVYISGNLNGQASLPSFDGIYGTTNWILDGSGLVSVAFGGATPRSITITGNYETYGIGVYLIDNNIFTYTAGTAGANFNILIGRRTTLSLVTNTISINQPTANIFLYSQALNPITPTQTINLGSPLNINLIGVFSNERPYTSDNTISKFSFSGNSVSANTLSLSPVFRSNSSLSYPQPAGSTTYQAPSIEFDYLYTHSIGSISANGGGIPSNPLISSNSSGNQVSINLGSKITTQIIDCDFTDVDASGGEEIVAINGTLTNTSNITNVYPTGGGGGTQTAYTFFS